MNALLLAGGLGTRLRPLTSQTPKCLVNIHNTPLLKIWLDKLSLIGVNNVVINTHYLSALVENFIKQAEIKINVKTSYEETLLGTAGTLLHHINDFISDDLILIHADNYCEDNLMDLIKFHSNRPECCKMTMMLFETNEPENCGIVKLDDQNIVIDFFEKVYNPPSKLANCAIYILSPEILKDILINHHQAVDFSKDIIPSYISQIFTYKTISKFFDIGTPENYLKANNK